MKQKETQKLHKESLVIDAHQDLIYTIVNYQKNIFKKSELYESDIQRMKIGGLNLTFLAIYTEPEYKLRKAPERMSYLLKHFQILIESNYLKQVKQLKDLKKLKEKVGIILSIEGADGICKKNLLSNLYKKGVRCISLTHNWENQYATGTNGPTKGGLKPAGKKMIQEMERLGIILDVSHLNRKSFWDVVKISRKPFIASHSNCYALKKHKRNLTDRQIKALAEAGGVIGINFWSTIVGRNKDIKSVVDHIDHIVNLTSIDHVGIGSDYDGIEGKVPRGLEDVSKLPNL